MLKLFLIVHFVTWIYCYILCRLEAYLKGSSWTRGDRISCLVIAFVPVFNIVASFGGTIEVLGPYFGKYFRNWMEKEVEW